MTLKEFSERNMNLEAQISQYMLMNAKKQTEICCNNQEIIKLKMKQRELQHEYAMDENYPVQKNLQGEIIKHEY